MAESFVGGQQGLRGLRERGRAGHQAPYLTTGGDRGAGPGFRHGVPVSSRSGLGKEHPFNSNCI